jgi:hypothetical protein
MGIDMASIATAAAELVDTATGTATGTGTAIGTGAATDCAASIGTDLT